MNGEHRGGTIASLEEIFEHEPADNIKRPLRLCQGIDPRRYVIVVTDNIEYNIS